MNTHSLSTIVLAAALSAPLFASPPAPNDPVPVGYFASKVSVPAWNYMWERMDSFDIVAGTARATVEKRMGQPKQMLSPDVWLYENCRPNFSKAQAQGCNLLLVTFDGQSVSELKFVNQPAATQIAAQLGARSNSYALGK